MISRLEFFLHITSAGKTFSRLLYVIINFPVLNRLAKQTTIHLNEKKNTKRSILDDGAESGEEMDTAAYTII